MLARMLRVLKLDSSVYEEVEHDRGATAQAMLVVVLVSIIGALGKILGPGGLKAAIGAAIAALFGWFLMSLVSLALGKLFGGKADMGEVLRALGFAYVPQVFGIIPYIGTLLAFVLGIIAWVQALRASLDVSTGIAVLVAIISFVLLAGLIVVLGLVLGIGAAAFGAGGT